MSDALASLLADLRRKLEDERPYEPAAEDPGCGEPAEEDLWQLSEKELDEAMSRRLADLHFLVSPPAEEAPVPTSFRGRVKLRLALRIYRWLAPLYGKYRDLNALLTELGLAAYIRQRQQERRLDELSGRIAGLEEDLALLRRRPEASARSDGAATDPD